MKKGNTSSCGCIWTEGKSSHRLTHGYTGTPVYRSWAGMRDRCLNPNTPAYANYGGRGITVCERWDWFENFLADMGEPPTPEHSIDRKDNNGDYSPENCRWATTEEQNRNRRSNVRVEFEGITRTLIEWIEITGQPRSLVYSRYEAGWPPEQIFRDWVH